MPNRYKAADRACAKLEKQIAAEFQNLRLRFPFDHLNIASFRRYVKNMYDRMEKRNYDAYVLIALAVYEDMSIAEAKRLVDRILGAYDPVPGYVYTREIPRNRDRAAEGMIAAADRASLRESAARAQRLWVAQTKQFADEVTDAAMLESYIDAGVKRVRWVSVEDEVRCGKCRSLDGKEFPIDEIPPKQHPHCRCYVVPVE